ncbi:MAG TPA: two-component regulator propeller domain-containing protein, partial [Pyrinomonadaceae bacterium]|nr:two-component regulator propeller domain-containing protein [Pyrinomonadaceae bacterium]
IDTRLVEVAGDQITVYGPQDAVGRQRIKSITEDAQGRLLVANEGSIFEMAPAAGGRARPRQLPLTIKSNQGIEVLLADRDGALWIGTWTGLVKLRDGKQSLYTDAQGLSDDKISSLLRDRDGNLWIGTVGGGVCKLSSEMIVSFTRAEGLPNRDVRKVIEDRNGNIYASIENGGLVKLSEGKAQQVEGSQTAPFTNFNERLVQDARGDWWVGTDAGLFRFDGPLLQLQRGHKFTSRDGLDEVAVGGLYTDAGGRFWVSPENQGLYCSEPSPNGAVSFKQIISPNSETLFNGVLRTIADRSQTLWLGGHEWLGRLIDRNLVMLPITDGLPETRPRAFFADSRGWLWIGLRYRGVSVTKNPSDANPSFSNFSTASGLASDAVWAITEDDLGRMYFGTGKGLDQLDLATGRIRHFNTDDGLASDIVNDCFKDRAGNIWIGTTLGLSKFDPRAETSRDAAAPVYLSRVQIAGEDLRLPETGANQLPGLELPAGRNNLTVDYVALSFQGENELRYEYKLEGVDNDWSAPTSARSINYARLAPGSYRFMVRSINRDGLISPQPAFFQFRILPPIWQRWWFVALAALAIGLVMYALYRQRLARLLELERVRTRIATDLHDDIGANLSLIAMLSEVSRGQLENGDLRLKEWLATIANTSRDTVDSMSDIVWAVNPKRDHLRDLIRRMRRFADDILAAREIELEFRAPENEKVKLGADLRREVFLIFKETINNIARHSEGTKASVDLRLENGLLSLVVSDNGKGLDPTPASDGHGLNSMRARAERLGGSFEVVSEGSGTRISLSVPVEHRFRPSNV